ncbi:muscle, skeletal receptor tyrosine protein kinase-like isoform X2 [Pecten maximus]|uniref:muscle, skeletal receptor tyrosine protein kinase-like isoform X2 n=1 Tax=Pecten maximus TaxID=6579 RepID=UPI0014587DCC|nr:muscle, skeletal receptor tyrosine protein kinase-like isoform X2 [Pecten maximus]
MYWIICVYVVLVWSLAPGHALDITRHPSNITVEERHRATLHCDAQGFGEIKTVWYHNGKRMRPHPKNNSNNININYKIKRNGRLIFIDTHVEDTGSYYCNVSDTTGLYTLSGKAYLQVDVPARFIEKGPHDRHVKFGVAVELTCIVTGVPKPTIKWFKNGIWLHKPYPMGMEITYNMYKATASVEFTGTETELSRLWIGNVTEEAIYNCTAVNTPKGRPFPIHREARVVPIPVNTEVHAGTAKPPQGQAPQCLPYNGSVCASVLGSRQVYIQRSIHELEDRVHALIHDLTTSHAPSTENRCHEAAQKILCQFHFPECIEAEEPEKKPTPKHLCRESCLGVKELLCFDQWLLVMNKENLQYSLPECEELPSKVGVNASCVDSQLFMRKDEEVTSTCYKGRGQWYNGTLNVTRSGKACQAWAASFPHTHRRPPSVFPTLQNSENYCRNPGAEESSPWCYTMEKHSRWELCDIPKCANPVPQDERETEEQPRFTLLAILIVTIVTSVGVFVIGLIIVLCYQIVSQRKQQVKYNSTPTDDLDIDIDKLTPNISYHKVSETLKLSPKLEGLEYPRNDIVYIKDIGQGAFGRVFKAKAPNLSKDGDDSIIAVKMLKDDASDDLLQDFSREASLMAEFKHPNIVKLLGVCAIGKPMCLLFEYMTKWDLNEYLRRSSPEHYIVMRPAVNVYEELPLLDNVDQLYISMQIAAGMVYLSERGYVHRDLATRNCLVGENLTVKIADFGLARSVHTIDYYKGSEHDAIPIRWMPLESILYNKFTAESDVWSFGVLIWEIFSFALQPYYGMTHEEVIKFIKDGKMLACPENTPKQVYDLMRLCWSRKPMHRPPFPTLYSSIKVMHDELQKKKIREKV